jgi:hypothetical protein
MVNTVSPKSGSESGLARHKHFRQLLTLLSLKTGRKQLTAYITKVVNAVVGISRAETARYRDAHSKRSLIYKNKPLPRFRECARIGLFYPPTSPQKLKGET